MNSARCARRIADGAVNRWRMKDVVRTDAGANALYE